MVKHDRKNVVMRAVLITVIVVVTVFTVKRVTNKPQAPQWLQDKLFEKIDMKSLEVVKVRLAD
jgi:hypothetical protein